MRVSLPHRPGMRGLGDAGTDPLPPPTTPPIGQVTLNTVGCPGTAWVNSSVTNTAGTNTACMIDYSTGEVIQVDPTTGVDAAGRPFWCHMPSIAGGQSPAAMPWICGTPAQRAATPDLATYRRQQGIPDPFSAQSNSDAYFASMAAQAPTSYASETSGGDGFGPAGGPPPPLPIPILQQIANAQQGYTIAATAAPAGGGAATGIAIPAVNAQQPAAMPNIVGTANGTAQPSGAVAPAPAAATGFSLSTTEILAIAGVGLFVLYSMHKRSVT